MRLVSGFLANHIEVQNGMLYVSGGFPEWWNVPTLPHSSVLAIGVVLELEAGELGAEHTVIAKVRKVGGPDLKAGITKFRRDSDPNHPSDSPYYMNLAFGVPIAFTEVGAHEVELTWDGFILDIVRFAVRLPAGS